MPLSSLLTTIIEQAKEPLHCLNGAGYFTDEEWVKLDLILNKKHTWTKSPTNPNSEASSSLPSSSDCSTPYARPKENPKLVAGNPSEVRVLSVAQSSDADWDLAPEFYSPVVAPPKSLEPRVITKAESLGPPATDKLLSSSTKFQSPEAKGLHSGLTKGLLHEIQPRNPTPKNSTSSISKPLTGVNLKILDAQKTLSSKSERIAAILAPIGPSDFRKRATQAPKPTSTGGASKGIQEDVNTFETRNAAEWDEAPPVYTNKNIKKNMSITTDRVIDKKVRGNAATHEVKVTTPSSSSSIARSVSSITTRSVSSATTRDPSTPLHRKEQRLTKDASPKIKTRICWFWAMSASGCRHRSEDCINLHVKPTPGAIVDSPSNRSKILQQSHSAPPSKSKTCWLWATTGACEKEKKCENVHGWVVGGVAPRPKNLNMDKRPIYPADQKLKVEKKLGKSLMIETR